MGLEAAQSNIGYWDKFSGIYFGTIHAAAAGEQNITLRPAHRLNLPER